MAWRYFKPPRFKSHTYPMLRQSFHSGSPRHPNNKHCVYLATSPSSSFSARVPPCPVHPLTSPLLFPNTQHTTRTPPDTLVIMPPLPGPAAGRDDDEFQEVHHLIEKSEEGRLGKDAGSSSTKPPSLDGRGNEGRGLPRLAFKVLLAGLALFVFLSLLERRGNTNTKDVNVGAAGPSAAEVAARVKEKELQQQLAAESIKREKAEADAAAAKQALEESKKKAAAAAEAEAVEKKKKQEEEEAAAAAAATKKKQEEDAATTETKKEGDGEAKTKPEEAAAAAEKVTPADAKPAAADIPAADLTKLDTAKAQATFAAARKAIATTLQTLQGEYGAEHAALLFQSVHFLDRDYIKHKLVRALLGQNGSPGKPKSEHDFVMSFAGTSVTAGHDNFYQQSYPVVMEKLIREAFVAAGLNLEVRNHAMGNQPPIPAAFCVQSQLGQDTDVAAWEFGMMVGGELQNSYVEEWMRNALHMPKRPALLMLDPGEGARKPDGDDKLPTTPRTGEPGDWSKSFGGLLEHYKAYGVHAQAMYEAVWSLDHLDKYNFKALVVDDKPTPRPAGWHPGPGGHLLRANILGHHYLTLLDEALVDVQGAVEKNEVPQLVAAAKKKEEEEGAALPAPLYCDPMFCGRAASCAMTFEPRVQGSLLDLVLVPAGLDKAAPTIESQDNKNWHTQLFEMDHEGVTFSQEQGFHYLDMKYVLQGNKEAGPLNLQVESTTKHHMLLCQPPGVWGKLPDQGGDLRKDAEVQIDGLAMPLETSTVFYHQHGLTSPTCFATKEQIQPGPHTVVVTPTNPEGKYIALSGLVWF